MPSVSSVPVTVLHDMCATRKKIAPSDPPIRLRSLFGAPTRKEGSSTADQVRPQPLVALYEAHDAPPLRRHHRSTQACPATAPCHPATAPPRDARRQPWSTAPTSPGGGPTVWRPARRWFSVALRHRLAGGTWRAGHVTSANATQSLPAATSPAIASPAVTPIALICPSQDTSTVPGSPLRQTGVLS